MKKQPEKRNMIDEFLNRIGHKIIQFKFARASRYLEFTQDCISSNSNEEERKYVSSHYLLFIMSILNVTMSLYISKKKKTLPSQRGCHGAFNWMETDPCCLFPLSCNFLEP